MRRVLLTTYHFPPGNAIGLIRPMGLAKYLPRYGWEPVVLTPRLPSEKRPSGLLPIGEVIETDYQDIMGKWKSRFGLDPERGIHQQLSLPRAKRPNSSLPHTALMKWLKTLLFFPDLTKGWMPFAAEAIAGLREGCPVDAIIT